MNRLLKRYGGEVAHFCKIAFRHVMLRLCGWVSRTVTVRTKQGLLTLSTRDDSIGASLFREGQYEFDASLRAVQFLKRSGFIPVDDVSMLDVGANIGIISIGLLLRKEIDRALAIEPEPGNFALLSRNIRQNGLSGSMLALPMAAGDRVSRLSMELSPTNPGDHRIRAVPVAAAPERAGESARRTIQVDSQPLPRILDRPDVHGFRLSSPSFMWIDVQGYEGYVFKGAREMLGEGLPTVSEIWPYGILRSGMTLEDFSKTVCSIWTDYWVERRDRFTRYPITVFDRYLDEIGTDGHFENVIFTKTPG